MTSRNAVVVAVSVGLLVAAGVGWYLFTVGSDFQQPEVQAIESEFGEVSENRTIVHSHMVVDNPNNDSLPMGATVRYDIAMNGIEVAHGTNRGIQLKPDRNTLNLTATLDNSRIPAWWVTHVNNGERTTMTTSGRVSLAGLPVGTDLPSRNQTIKTNILGPLGNDTTRHVAVANESILRVSDRRVSWGDADREATPAWFAAALENTHDRPVRIDGTAYEIRMNDVTVGQGTTTDGIVLSPGESGTFTTNVSIDTPRMHHWWVSHVANNETTRFQVEVYAVVDRDGERHRVPLAVIDRRARFRTDLLGSSNGTVEVIPPGSEEEFNRPEVVDTHGEWGEVTGQTTEVITRATVSNPNEEFSDVVRFHIDGTTTINGIVVTRSDGTLDGLDAGTNTLDMTGEMDHDDVPRWWARHLNNDEQSTVETVTNGTVDIGVTTVEVDPPDRTNTVQTELLAGLNNDTARSVESEDGRHLATIQRTQATWGEATADHAPVRIELTITNQQPTTMTVRDVEHVVAINDITLADDTVTESWTIAPYSTRTIELTVDLDNSRMADWWPTHVRNEERSVLHTEAKATIEVGGYTERIDIESLGGDTPVETDLLGED